ncbi:MAG: hypothetical protein WDN10_01490 [bacterium]
MTLRNIQLDKKTLKKFVASGFIAWKEKPVTFKSGLSSHVYVGGRDDLTHDPELLLAIGGALAKRVKALTPKGFLPCLIGIPSAGRTLAQAAAMHPKGKFAFEILRDRKKAYGAHKKWVDGRPQPKRFFYFTIDNTITDGASKYEAFERLCEDGYPAKRMSHLILVDREEGGAEKLRARGYRVETVWNLTDIVRALVAHKIWTQKRGAIALAEIAENRKAVSAV